MQCFIFFLFQVTQNEAVRRCYSTSSYRDGPCNEFQATVLLSTDQCLAFFGKKRTVSKADVNKFLKNASVINRRGTAVHSTGAPSSVHARLDQARDELDFLTNKRKRLSRPNSENKKSKLDP